MKNPIFPKGGAKPLAPYSPGIELDNLIFVSGQIALDSESNLVGETIEDQTHQVMKNLLVVLEGIGLDFSDVVKAEIFLTDMNNYSKMNEIYGSYLSEPFPARLTVGVSSLPKNALVEIAVMAQKRK